MFKLFSFKDGYNAVCLDLFESIDRSDYYEGFRENLLDLGAS